MRLWIFFAAINGVVAVAMGALGSHVLSGRLDDGRMTFIDLAVNYQLWHALGLLGVGLLTPYVSEGRGPGILRMAGIAFVFGIVGFCGGLYILGLTGPGIVHWVIPLGGSLLIAGWIGLSASAFFIDPKRYRK